MKDLSENYLPATFKKMEVMVMKNGVEKGWIVGQNVSAASYNYFQHMEYNCNACR